MISRLLASLLLACAAFGASAQSSSPSSATTTGMLNGVYLQGLVGAAFPDDADFDAGPLSAKLELDTGFAGSVIAGYQFPFGLRAELEYAYRRLEADSFAGFQASGHNSINAVMANVAYEFRTDFWLRPYLGAGAGYAWTGGDEIRASGFTVDVDGDGVAYQGFAGLVLDLGGPLKGVLDYRYFRVPDVRYTLAPGLSSEDDLSTHTVMIGLRWSF